MMECSYENQILDAARTGKWTPELRQHWSDCPSCSEAVLVAEFLNAQAEPEVPAAGLVWFKSELRRRQDAMDRAMQPLRWAERAVILAGIVVGLASLAWTAGQSEIAGLTAIGGVVLLAGLGLLSASAHPNQKARNGKG